MVSPVRRPWWSARLVRAGAALTLAAAASAVGALPSAPSDSPSDSPSPFVSASVQQTGTPFTGPGVAVTAVPEPVERGKPVTVTLTGVPSGLTIITCQVVLGLAVAACAGGPAGQREVLVTVPADTPEGSELPLSWTFTYTYGYGKEPTEKGHGSTVVRVALPSPEFSVLPATDAALPGLPFVVTFASSTPGVTVTGCGLTYRSREPCSRSGVAVVMIPPDTPPNSSITFSWDLSYTSTRPGEQPGARADRLTVRVVAEQPRFIAGVQPARGLPGQEVTLTLEPAVPGVSIVGCLAFFPNGDEGTCQRSRRWFARTRIPSDAPPGATLLRWGVGAITADGRPYVGNGVLPFEVLPAVLTPSSPSPSPSPSVSPSPVLSPAPSASAGGEPTAAFVAVTDPESAEPGHRVTVTVEALTSGTAVTGCRAAFAGQAGTRCARSAGRWTATVTVPAGARPGDLPLTWSVTSRSSSGAAGRDGGVITYRVLGRGAPAPPQFTVEVRPGSVAPGGHVAVIHRPDDAGVTITGCSAGYSPGGASATCRNTGQGWAADVVVPQNAPPGTGTVLWQVAYARPAGAGSADGLTGLGVQPVAQGPEDWPSKLWGIAWRGAAGALVLAALIGSRTVARRLRGRSRLPAGVTVVAVRPAGLMNVVLHDPQAGPRRRIRLAVRRGRPRIDLYEEP